MTSRRLLKAAEAIRDVVSMAILTELKDPRVKNVTVTKVEVLPDMKQAKVYVTIMGEETQQRLTLRGLQNSAGFLQHKIASRIETRYTPRLEFILDSGVKNALEIDRILRRVLPKDDAAQDDDHDDVEEVDELEEAGLSDEVDVADEVDQSDGSDETDARNSGSP